LTTSSYYLGSSPTTSDSFDFTTPTTTGLGSSSTGLNQVSDSSDANGLALGGIRQGLLIAAGLAVGALVL
jgi:hypothetical protein